MALVIGLDLGSRSAKAVIAEKGFRGIEIQEFVEIPITAELSEYPTAALVEHVRKPGATWAVKLPGERVALRVLSLPFGDSRAIEQVLPGEIEAALPFDLDDIVYDSHIIERSSDGSRVLVAAARKDDIATFLDPLKELRVDPRVLDAEPLSLGALAAVEPTLREGNIALIDAGHRRTGIVILEDGVVSFGRTVANGGARLERALAKDAGLDAAQAQRTISSGVVERDDGSADAVLYKAAVQLAQEISRTINSTSNMPSKIVLAGGLALVPGFPQLLERVTRIPVDLFELTDADAGIANIPEHDRPRAAAALALALRASGETKQVDISLRKDSFSYQRDTRELGGFFVRIGAIVAILLLLAGIDFGVKLVMLKTERSQIEGNIVGTASAILPGVPKSRFKNSEMAVSLVQGELSKLETQVSTLEGSSTSGLEVLREVSLRIPDDVTIDVSKFDFSNGQLRIEGATSDFASVDRIVDALKGTDSFFREVQVINRGSEPGSGRKTFKISAKTAATEQS